MFLSWAQPSTAGSVWFGALVGALVAFLVGLGLSIVFSLTAGPTIDQLISGTSTSVSLFSNPLLVFVGAHLSGIDLKGAGGSAEIGLPATLLSLFPIPGLLLGGALAASTDFTGRRLFSITRGASIGIIYAFLVLITSLATSSTITSTSSSFEPVTNSLVVAPNAGSAFLYALLGGAGFGALGGAWRGRRLPRGPASAQTPFSNRIRGALVGAGVAISMQFVLCLLVAVLLFISAQQNVTAPLSTASGFTGGLCSTSSPSTLPAALPGNLPVFLLFLLISPLEVLWLMALSLGAPLQVSEGPVTVTIGLFGADCPPTLQAQWLFLLLLIPAVSLFVGGWAAARIARPRTGGEAFGVALLLTAALALLLLLVAFLGTFSVGLNRAGSGAAAASIGPSAGGILLAGVIFGATLGALGSLMGRPRAFLPPQPVPGGGWPMPPGP